MKYLGAVHDFPTLTRISRLLSTIVLLWSPFALAGLIWHVSALANLFVGPAQMSAPTIAGFVAANIVILQFTSKKPRTRTTEICQYVLVTFIIMINLYALIDYAGFIASDKYLPLYERGALFGSRLGHVSMGTAICFLLLALSLAIGRTKPSAHISAGLAGLGLIITALAMIGYAFNAAALTNVLFFSSMALPTAVGFALTFSAALTARPTLGWMARMVGPDSGGVAARRLLPAIVVVPIIISAIVGNEVERNDFAAGFGFALMAIMTTTTLAIITYLISIWLARRDIEVTEEVDLRRVAQSRLEIQNDRLNLLNQIAHAINERQDLTSIFQVVLRTLEDRLPIDFGMICLYDSIDHSLTVRKVATKSALLASALNLNERSLIAIGENGLSNCVKGNLVYEPDMRDTRFPFPRRLADQQLNAMVLTPLMAEGNVFAILVCAKSKPHSFSSSDCEFLMQLGEHVALGAQQSQLYQNLHTAYEELRNTQQAAMQQERLRAVGQMASGIAHDINNAISPISLRTQALLENQDDLPPRAVDYLNSVKRQIDDVAATVGRLREFYREREETTVLTPVDINALVNEVVELSSARWKDMSLRDGITINVEKHLSPENPIIMGKDNELREALINLIFNAVDAMPQGGTITLSTRGTNLRAAGNEGRKVLLDITDTGMGMNAATLRRCMEPFYTTKGEQGTGLGLAMVYGILKRHEANVEIASEPGKGTTFSLTFPLPENAVAMDILPDRNIKPEPMRLLIVDDDPYVLDSLCAVLGLDNHDIVSASDSREGVELFRASLSEGKHFDAVITDLGMPYMDGNQLTHAIKGMSGNTPVILLTGWGQRLGDDHLHDGRKADFVIGKPPQMVKLRDTLIRCKAMGA